MKTHTLEDVVTRQKQHLFRDLLAIAVLILGLGLAVFSFVQLPTASTSPQSETRIVLEGQSPAAITARQIDDTPHYL